uniref:Uncharacterized protein n=1 Tax=Arundo donax TaxID=35708 RepID=A0A0A9C4Z4_ARUDO
MPLVAVPSRAVPYKREGSTVWFSS